MATQRTLALIKPDAVSRHLVGEVLGRAQEGELQPVALRMVHLTEAAARAFYAVHAGRPFYDSLVAFMTEGPIVAVVLEGEDAIARWREVMGATDPAEAAAGSIRADLGTSKERNCAHGSDSPDNAALEVRFFFSELDLIQAA